MTLAMSGATPEDSGLASGLVNTTQQVGGALGLAVLATLSTTRTSSLVAHGASNAAALTDGYHLAFTIAAGLVLVAIAMGVVFLRPTRALEAMSDPDEVVDGRDRARVPGAGCLDDRGLPARAPRRAAHAGGHAAGSDAGGTVRAPTIRHPGGRLRDRIRRERPGAVHRPGLAHRRGPDARLHERRGAARARARPARCTSSAARARSCGTRARRSGNTQALQGDPLRLRRRRRARAGRAGGPGVPHRRAHLLSPRRADPGGAVRGAPELERTIAERAATRPRLVHRDAARRPRPAPARRSRRRPRRWSGRLARSPTSASPRRPPTSSTTSRCCSAAAALTLADAERVLDGRRQPLRRPRPASPRRSSRRERWPRDYNLIPLRETFIDDCQTPVSAFLKLRDADPGARRSCSSRPTRAASDATRSSAFARARSCAGRSATPATRTRSRPPSSAASASRRCPTCRRSPAAPSGCSPTTWCARSSRSARPTPTRSGCPTWR